MVVDITVGDEPARSIDTDSHEDRLILVRAATADEARAKGEAAAASYHHEYANADGETVRWAVRGIADVHQVMDAEIADGTEVYSAFIDREWADALMRGSDSPIKAWQRVHPGEDVMSASVAEVMEAWTGERGD